MKYFRTHNLTKEELIMHAKNILNLYSGFTQIAINGIQFIEYNILDDRASIRVCGDPEGGFIVDDTQAPYTKTFTLVLDTKVEEGYNSLHYTLEIRHPDKTILYEFEDTKCLKDNYSELDAYMLFIRYHHKLTMNVYDYDL